jgi:predicted dehydrogenase
MIAVPAVDHHAVAARVLDAGKHAYVEKPIALSVVDGEDLVRRARAGGLQLMVGHLLLYHPCVRWAKAAIDRGELGEVLYLSSVRVNLGKVRSDENAMWSLAPHDISVAMHLLGEEPVAVAAQGFSYLQDARGIEDVVFLTLRFRDGRAAQIHVSWLDPHKERVLTVVGSRKMLTFDDMAASEKVRVYDKGVDRAEQPLDAPTYESYGDLLTLRQGDILIPRVPMREPLRTLCETFLAAVDRGTVPLSDGDNGVAVLRVLEAGQRSLAAGGAPVAVRAEAT